jgi:hypothetical protein
MRTDSNLRGNELKSLRIPIVESLEVTAPSIMRLIRVPLIILFLFVFRQSWWRRDSVRRRDNKSPEKDYRCCDKSHLCDCVCRGS